MAATDEFPDMTGKGDSASPVAGAGEETDLLDSFDLAPVKSAGYAMTAAGDQAVAHTEADDLLDETGTSYTTAIEDMLEESASGNQPAGEQSHCAGSQEEAALLGSDHPESQDSQEELDEDRLLGDEHAQSEPTHRERSETAADAASPGQPSPEPQQDNTGTGAVTELSAEPEDSNESDDIAYTAPFQALQDTTLSEETQGDMPSASESGESQDLAGLEQKCDVDSVDNSETETDKERTDTDREHDTEGTATEQESDIHVLEGSVTMETENTDIERLQNMPTDSPADNLEGKVDTGDSAGDFDGENCEEAMEEDTEDMKKGDAAKDSHLGVESQDAEDAKQVEAKKDSEQTSVLPQDTEDAMEVEESKAPSENAVMAEDIKQEPTEPETSVKEGGDVATAVTMEKVKEKEVKEEEQEPAQSGEKAASMEVETDETTTVAKEEGVADQEEGTGDDKVAGGEIEETENSKGDNSDETEADGTMGLKIVGVTSAVGMEDVGAGEEQSKNGSEVKASGEEKDTECPVVIDDEAEKKDDGGLGIQITAVSGSVDTAAEDKKDQKDDVKSEEEQKPKEEKQLSKADDAGDDDDVIAVKEEKRPVQKQKTGSASKIQKCVVCQKIGKCKYNIVRNGDIKHLCDDNCFKQFRNNPTAFLRQSDPKATTNNGTSPAGTSTQTTSGAPAKPAAPASNSVPATGTPTQVYKTCSICQVMNIRTTKPFLNWQGLDFCGEECLGKFQSGLSSTCCYCGSQIAQTLRAKFCFKVGSDIKQFCSSSCHTEYIKRLKVCAFCNRDLKKVSDSFMAPVGKQGTFKDFCSQACLGKYEEKNNQEVEIVGVEKVQKAPTAPKGSFKCAVCHKVGPVKHEIKLEGKANHLCTDPCLLAFQYANKLTMNTCDNCNSSCYNAGRQPQFIQYEGHQKRFCSFMCVNTFREANKKTVTCAWCGAKKGNFDMIERVDANNKYQLFCSLNCLSLYRVNLQATSNQAVLCDQCRKFVPAQYHLTMSDASVRNFCSYGCVMSFQSQFTQPAKQAQKNTPQAPPAKTPQPPPQQTTRSGRPITRGVTQQQQTPKAGLTKAAKTAPTKQQSPGSVPIISNVVSLAPQGGQQQINLKSQGNVPVVLSNQQPGVKTTTTTTGNQTVQQQIIIQPPPPKTVKNKSLMCKPFVQTKATSCRPHTQTKEVQTDEDFEPKKHFIPVPVPIYIPCPMAMYTTPTPVPIAVPIPIPVPVFIPTTKKNAGSILKHIKEIREKIPADPLEAELLMMAEAVAGKTLNSDSDDDDATEDTRPSFDAILPEVSDTPTEVPAAAKSSGGELGEDMLQMALRMASEMSSEPVMDLETSLEPMAVNPAFLKKKPKTFEADAQCATDGQRTKGTDSSLDSEMPSDNDLDLDVKMPLPDPLTLAAIFSEELSLADSQPVQSLEEKDEDNRVVSMQTDSDDSSGQVDCSTVENGENETVMSDAGAYPTQSAVDNQQSSTSGPEEVLRDKNCPAIFVPKVAHSDMYMYHQKMKKNGRVQNLRHACLFCGQLRGHIQDHYLRKHKNQKTVKAIASCRNDKEREKMKNFLRATGDHAHNKRVVDSQAGELLLFRRPKEPFDHRDYGPCLVCKEWVLLSSVTKHLKTCKGETTSEKPVQPVTKAVKRDTPKLPDPQDIQLLGEYLARGLSDADLEKEMVDYLTYRDLVELTQARLLVYNQRRTGEIEQITIEQYRHKLAIADLAEGALKEMTELERHLVDTHDLIQTQGQYGGMVPVLIPSDCGSVMDFLVDSHVRSSCAIESSFIFASSSGDPFPAYTSLQKACTRCGIERLQRISSPYLRKHRATLAQVVNLSPPDLEQLCRHLSTTTRVHFTHDGTMLPCIERINLAKILLMQDLNMEANDVGKSLLEIDFIDIVRHRFTVAVDESATDQLQTPQESLAEKDGQTEEGEDVRLSTALWQECDSPGEEEEPRKEIQRQRWSPKEIAEIRKYFSKHLMSKTVPRRKECLKVQQRSLKEGGELHKRNYHLIVKKVSALNHSKTTNPVYSCEKCDPGSRVSDSGTSLVQQEEDDASFSTDSAQQCDQLQNVEKNRPPIVYLSPQKEDACVFTNSVSPDEDAMTRMVKTRKIVQKWSAKELAELRRYFSKHLQAKVAPRREACLKAQKLSFKEGGELYKRNWPLIVKKVSALNHAKNTIPVYSCEKSDNGTFSHSDASVGQQDKDDASFFTDSPQQCDQLQNVEKDWPPSVSSSPQKEDTCVFTDLVQKCGQLQSRKDSQSESVSLSQPEDVTRFSLNQGPGSVSPDEDAVTWMVKTRKIVQKWSTTELAELQRYFSKHLQAKVAPRREACLKAQKLSFKEGGELHKRKWPLIVKKVSALNHAKTTNPVYSCEKSDTGIFSHSDASVGQQDKDDASFFNDSTQQCDQLQSVEKNWPPSVSPSPQKEDACVFTNSVSPDEDAVTRMVKTRKIVQRWSRTELAELRRYFSKHLQTKVAPRREDCLKAQKLSLKEGGELYKRHWPLIVKKVSALNHYKKKDPIYRCEKCDKTFTHSDSEKTPQSSCGESISPESLQEK